MPPVLSCRRSSCSSFRLVSRLAFLFTNPDANADIHFVKPLLHQALVEYVHKETSRLGQDKGLGFRVRVRVRLRFRLRLWVRVRVEVSVSEVKGSGLCLIEGEDKTRQDKTRQD